MKILLSVAVLFVILIPVGYYFVQPKEEKLPVLNPVDLNDATVDPELLRIGYGHKIGSFRFQNQHGDFISDKDLENRIWVAEYFFTTCGSICPIMNEQMYRIQGEFKGNDDVRLLSFTVDPDNDSVGQLKKYASRHGVSAPTWNLFTGEKTELYDLARKSFFLLKPSAVEKKGDGGSDFIHTNNFVLVDRERRIRGYYDGTSPTEVDDLIKDINRLLAEKAE